MADDQLEPRALAEFIFEWLENRNGGEFEDAILKMTVGDRRLALDELTLILTHRKRPPTWIR